MNKKLMGAAALMTLATVLAVGCGGGDKKAAAPAGDKKGVSGELMVYTSIYPDIIDKLCKPNVAKAFPELKVTWFQGGTEKVKTKIAGDWRRCFDGGGSLLLSGPQKAKSVDEL